MKHWLFEVWDFRGRWIRGTVEASTTARALALAVRAVPEYRNTARKGLAVTVKVTRID